MQRRLVVGRTLLACTIVRGRFRRRVRGIQNPLADLWVFCRLSDTQILATTGWHETAQYQELVSTCLAKFLSIWCEKKKISVFSDSNLGKCVEISGPITQRSTAEPTQFWITFNTQVKITCYFFHFLVSS